MADKNVVIPISSDHAGFKLKKFLLENFDLEGFILKDFGTFSEDSIDYPDFIHPVASAVNKGDFAKAVIICGSGQGANMTANKYQAVRSALCWNIEQAELSRQHNDANIIALPGRFIEFEIALLAVYKFLNTVFQAGRHQVRVEKMTKLLN
jgi:ribose 5-phosphate isomerase B